MRSSPRVVVGETERESVVCGKCHLGRGISSRLLEATRVVVNRRCRGRVRADFDDEVDVAAQVRSTGEFFGDEFFYMVM